ncbi:hypothetical protein C1H76_1776 [Elsinoe australis]|uniref:DJ-1/PfpI domain-containing protein n=1 Tax=Elsinoe australis TaxID=40998 RepID=A0A4U7B8V8_9PEZI|nr:hypothetical protein C1H76_1776 [Elsinoe australis]
MSFNLAKPDRTIHVGVILLNAEIEILDVAPVDLLHGMSKAFINTLPIPSVFKEQGLDVEIHWVNEHGDLARLTSGITLQATHSFSTSPPLDIVLMGASLGDYQPNAAEVAFIRQAYESCSAYISICGGMMAPLAAGLLEGKTCTGPRGMLEGLRNSNPEVNWVERRWVQDGKVWTSGTLLNGLDLMKAFVEQVWGGPGTLAEFLVGFGSWPVRDVEYRDGP